MAPDRFGLENAQICGVDPGGVRNLRQEKLDAACAVDAVRLPRGPAPASGLDRQGRADMQLLELLVVDGRWRA
ncbi:MAG: hypothetical protein ACKODL_02335, partial [Phenylobacterium sp.]